jgi:hypothetical protein
MRTELGDGKASVVGQQVVPAKMARIVVAISRESLRQTGAQFTRVASCGVALDPKICGIVVKEHTKYGNLVIVTTARDRRRKATGPEAANTSSPGR